jgi:hypothetical protein
MGGPTSGWPTVIASVKRLRFIRSLPQAGKGYGA